MADDDWHRRTTWTDEDQQAFFARFARCRTDSTRTQSLRIQAMTLNRHGNPTAALELLNKLLREFPEDYFRGLTYTARAESYEALGQIDAAMSDYRTALALEYGECPNVHTNAWLDLPWLIVKYDVAQCFDEAIAALERGEKQQSIVFPVTRYICESVRAVIAAHRGSMDASRIHAHAAMEASARERSGLRYHADLGLVSEDLMATCVHARVVELAS